MHYPGMMPQMETSAEYSMICAINNLQTRILQCQNEEQRNKLRDLLNTCKYIAETLASLAWVPSEDDHRRYQSAHLGEVRAIVAR